MKAKLSIAKTKKFLFVKSLSKFEISVGELVFVNLLLSYKHMKNSQSELG